MLINPQKNNHHRRKQTYPLTQTFDAAGGWKNAPED